MKQRKGFTLIELMIVIAIIIILAAIAIPNYLRMTDRARRSRVAGDFASIATALEAYSVDWGKYPVAVGAQLIMKTAINTMIESELGGDVANAGGATVNIATKYTLTGEVGPIDYIKAETLKAMYNPFDTVAGYYYASNATGTHWVLAVQYKTTPADYLWRSDGSTDLTEVTGVTALAVNVAISDAGAVSP